MFRSFSRPLYELGPAQDFFLLNFYLPLLLTHLESTRFVRNKLYTNI